MTDRMRRWVPALLLILLTVAVFSPALQNGFVSWDDDKNFLQNPFYRGFTLTNLRWMFSSFHSALYIPVTWLTLALDYSLWGMAPAGYHLTNILLHALNAVLFYWLATVLYKKALPALAVAPGQISWPAVAAAALFALHPLRAESVAWVTERRDILSGTFFFGALLTYLNFSEAPAQRRSAYWSALILFVLSLLSKPSTMVLPAVFLILDVYPLRRPESLGQRVFEKAPFFLTALVFAGLAFYGQKGAGASADLARVDVPGRLAIAAYGAAFYIRKTLWPSDLSPFYQLPLEIHPAAPMFVFSLIFVLVLSIALFALRKRWPSALAVWLSYLVILAPVSGLFQSGPQIAADRYSYLACLGWALLVAGTFAVSAYRRVLMGLVCLIVMGLGIRSYQQAQVWHDSETLWRAVLTIDPDTSFAHNNLGNFLREQGRFDEALAHLQTALRLRPEPGMYYNLALTLQQRGHSKEAIAFYREALARTEGNADMHYNFGTALLNTGALDEAASQYEATLKVDPRSAFAHNNLGVIYLLKKKFPEAADHCTQAIHLRPDYADAYNNLGSALASQQKWPEAAVHFEKALQLNSTLTSAQKSLAIVKTHL